MKKIAIIFISVLVATAGFSKDIRDKKREYIPIQRFSIEATGIMGKLSQDVSMWGKAGNYEQPAVYNPGTLKSSDWKFNNGGDVQFAYFPGFKRHFGVGVGIMYFGVTGKLAVDSFRVEYREADSRNQPYRQVVTITSVKETVNVTNISIPVVAKYKVNLSKRITFSADAGLLINLIESAKYSAEASGDFEAIYKFGQGGTVEYDGAINPGQGDWFITQNYYPTTTAHHYFDSLRQRGYNVALDVQPNGKSGTVSYKMGSIGFLIRPAIAYNLSRDLSVTLGGYFMSQTVKNTPKDSYRLMDINGKYSSVMNTVTTFKSSSYGVNLGLRYSFGW